MGYGRTELEKASRVEEEFKFEKISKIFGETWLKAASSGSTPSTET